MQEDMHYYGTKAIALAAGFDPKDAEVVAYSAQYVDDSTKRDSATHSDGGLLYGLASAHHPLDCALNSMADRPEQRRVWVPFHFLPGGEGTSFEEKLLCVKDSLIANEMFKNHIALAKIKEYRFPLLGIAAHVYMDTFSHYGFSGISSEYNSIVTDSLDVTPKSERIKNYIISKLASFKDKYCQIIGAGADQFSNSLGHGAVATNPDRPYLNWEFSFEKERPGNGKISKRRNSIIYLEACRKLYGYFRQSASELYSEDHSMKFEDIEAKVKEIIEFEGRKEERIDKWLNSGLLDGNTERYSSRIWEKEKDNFSKYSSSLDGISSDVYRFHQAVAYHRYYVLKDLLPGHGIAVY